MARLAQNITTARPGLTLEQAIGGRVAGLDEVGRGPLAGPVVACAVVLPDPLPASLADLLDDSKRLSPPRRDAAALALRRGAAARVDGESTGVVVGLAAGSALAWGLTTGTAAAAEAGTAVAGAAGALAEEAVVLLGITASSCSAGGA